MKYIIGIVILFSYKNSVEQTIQLDDIIKVYSMDSTAFKKFCDGKNFKLFDHLSTDQYNSIVFETPDSSMLLQSYYSDSVNRLAIVTFFSSSTRAYQNLISEIKKSGYHLTGSNKTNIAENSYELKEVYNKDDLWIRCLDLYTDGDHTYSIMITPRRFDWF